jgi:hypothetical protein
MGQYANGKKFVKAVKVGKTGKGSNDGNSGSNAAKERQTSPRSLIRFVAAIRYIEPICICFVQSIFSSIRFSESVAVAKTIHF